MARYRKYIATNIGDEGIRFMAPGFLISGLAVDNITAGWIKLSTGQWVAPYTTGFSTPVFPAAQVVDAQYSAGPLGGTVATPGANDVAPVVYLYEDEVSFNAGFAISTSQPLGDAIASPSTVSYGAYNYLFNSITGKWDQAREADGLNTAKNRLGVAASSPYLQDIATPSQYYSAIGGADDTDGIAPQGLARYQLMMARLTYVNNAGTWDRARGNTTTGLDVNIERVTAVVGGNSVANTTQTITLPAPGAGLYHYITHIWIARQATAALAGGALLSYTTTNLGGIAWRVGNAMVAGGTQIDVDQEYVHPWRSAVANTPSTIVCPAAGAAVTTTVMVWYYTNS